MEVNVLKINTDETEILMFGCDKVGRVDEKGKWPCGVCKNSVDANSLLCHNLPYIGSQAI